MVDEKDLDIVQKVGAAYDELLEKKRELVRLNTEEARLAGEQIGYAEAARSEAAAQIAASEKALDILGRSNAELAAKAEKYQKMLEQNEKTNELSAEQKRIAREHVEEFEKIKHLGADELENLRNRHKTNIATNKAMERRVELADSTADSVASLVGMGEKYKTTLTGQLMILAKQKGGLQELGKLMKEKVSLENFSANSVMKVQEATALLFKEQDASIETFRRATGAGSEYNKVIVDTQIDLRSYGVSTADTAEATAALFGEVKAFNDMGQQQQQVLVGNIAVLKQFGVATQDAATATSILIDGLGMSAHQAEETQRQLFATAHALGLPPQVIFRDFAQASSQLSLHGDNMVGVFQKLAAATKATGAQMSTFMDFAGQFDRFESGAQAVGKMNALLGGPYLNTIRMMNVDEGERIRLTLQAVEASGKSFKSMSRMEKMAFANAAGIRDMGEANKIFGKSLAEYDRAAAKAKAASISQKEFNKAAQNAQGVMTKFATIGRNLAVSLEFLLEPLGELADKILELQEYMGNWFGAAALGVGILGFFATSLIGVAKAMLMAAFAGKASAAGAAAGSKSMERMGRASAKAAPGILALGGAVALVGTGVAVAAVGLAEFVKAFKGLEPAQLSAVNKALAGFAIAVPAVIAALAIGGKTLSSPQIATGVAVLGGAFLAVGAGIWLAAEGMASLVEAASSNLEALKELSTLLGQATIQANMISVAGVAGGVGLLALAAGFGALNLQLRLLPFEELKAAATLADGLARLGEGGTGEVAVSAVRKVFTEIDNVDSGKLNDANQLVQAYTARTAAGGAGGAGTAMETTNNLLKTLIGAVGEVNVSVSSNPGEIIVKLGEEVLGKSMMKYINKKTSPNR